MLAHRSVRETRRWLMTLAILSLLAPALLGARSKTPKDRAPSRGTRLAVERAAALADRSVADWLALEQRFEAGDASVAELQELRIHWAASGDPWYQRSTWTLKLLDAGIDGPTAVQLPTAVLEGDLEAVDAVVGALATARGTAPAELLLLQAAALWGLHREGAAALAYDAALEGEAVFIYYDQALEEWLRARAASASGEQVGEYVPGDGLKWEALRQELKSREPLGQLALAFLMAVPPPAGGYTPSGEIEVDVVDELFSTRRQDLYFCFENAGGVNQLGHGSVTLDLDVDPLGRVGFCSVQPSSELKDRGLWDCCCRTVGSLQFPLPSGEGKATVRQRVVFPLE
jgi:hypothetical protein